MPVTDLVTNTPATTVKKKKTELLPLAQPGQPVQLMNTVQDPTNQDVQASTNKTILQAQQQAAQPQGNTLLTQTNKTAQEFLNTPALDVNKQKQVQLEQFDRDRAGAIESTRQGMAGQSTQDEALLDMAIKGAQDRAVLGNTLDTELAKQQRDDYLAKLTAGQSQSNTEQGLTNQRIANLVSTVGGAEGINQRAFQGSENELGRAQQLLVQSNDIQGQKDLAAIQGKITSGQQVTQQEFQAGQAALDRAQQIAIQNNDITAQKEIENLRNTFQNAILDKTQTFQASQAQMDRAQQLLVQSNDIEGQKALANINNAAQKGRLMTQLDVTRAESALDRANQIALQNGDIEGQKQIEQIRGTLQAQLQASDQQFQAKIKTMDIDSQKELTTLKASLDKDQLMTQQDFQGAQASLDRELQKAIQSGDINAQISLLQMKQDFEDKATTKQNEFSKAERQATQAWESGERMSTQDYDKSKQYLDQQFELAKQSNDIDTQKYLQQKQTELELAMQTAGFDDSQKKMYIQEQIDNSTKSIEFQHTVALQAQQNTLQKQRMTLQGQIDEAKAANDNVRAADLMQQQNTLDQNNIILQGNIDQAKQQQGYVQAMALQKANNDYDFKKLASEQGHDVAMANLNNKLEQALQNNDQENALALESQKYLYTAIENNKDRALQKLSVDLQAKGLDMQQWEQQYNAIVDQEEAGTAQPGAARDFLNQQLAGTGVKLEETSPADEYKAIAANYKQQQYQYVLTNPSAAVLISGGANKLFERSGVPGSMEIINGTVVPTKEQIAWAITNAPDLVEMSPTAAADFNKFINKTLYQTAPKNMTPADATARQAAQQQIDQARQYLGAGNSDETKANANRIIAEQTGVIQGIDNKYVA